MCPVFLDLILRGIHLDDPDFLSLNVTLTKSVQNVILNTYRFDSIETNQSFPYSTLPPLLLQVGTNFALSKYTLSFLYVHIFNLFISAYKHFNREKILDKTFLVF